MVAWILGAVAGVLAWLLWRFRPAPVQVTVAVVDPYAAEVAEFRRAVNDWSRG